MRKKWIWLCVVSAMVALAGCDQEEKVLDPKSFDSEIAFVYEKVEAFNQEEAYDSLSEEHHVFDYQYLRAVEEGYEMQFQRGDGVMAKFLFREDERLMQITLYADAKAGKAIQENGIDVASMLMDTLFQAAMDEKNIYDFMLLCSDWNETIKVSLEDQNLHTVIIDKKKETCTTTITLAKARPLLIEV